MSGNGKRDGGTEAAARRAVVDTARAMGASGLSPGRSGNVSRRWLGGMLITPSGMAYEATTPRDIVFVAADGKIADAARKPSSEWRFHLDTYAARADCGAIVHCHSMHATVLACAHRPIPAFHYMVAAAGGSDIPIAPYATFGSDALARHVAACLADRQACLMAHHGAIALGRTLPEALELAQEVEVLAEQYIKVLALGPPALLPDSEMKTVLELFKSYGRNAPDE